MATGQRSQLGLHIMRLLEWPQQVQWRLGHMAAISLVLLLVLTITTPMCFHATADESMDVAVETALNESPSEKVEQKDHADKVVAESALITPPPPSSVMEPSVVLKTTPQPPRPKDLLVNDPKGYRIKPGDVVTVSIVGLDKPGVESTVTRTINELGRLPHPQLGHLPLQRNTIPEAERFLRD